MADDRIAQVEVIIFKLVDRIPHYLLLKRIPSRGGFWQPVTGGVNAGEDFALAAKREAEEETGVSEFLNFYEDVHFFEFNSIGYGHRGEHVYGAQIKTDAEIILSSEHDGMKWCTLDEALDTLKYESNKEGVRKLAILISEG